MRHEQIDGELEKALASLREVPMPDSERVAAKRAAFLTQARRYRRSVVSRQDVVRQTLWRARSWGTRFSRRFKMVNALVAAMVLIAALAGGGGVVYAADAAGPGDLLYEIDRAIESVQLRLTNDTWQRVELLLSFAEERLGEAEALPGVENASNRGAALSGWGETISALAGTIAGAQGIDDEALATTVDAALSVQEGHLSQMLADGEDAEDEEDGDNPCDGGFTHPAAEGLADAYEVEYETVIGWFCDGYGLGEIMLALETAKATGGVPEDLLGWKTELGGWGQVWQELDLIGKPENAGPPEGVPGKPEDTGPPDGAGPPEGVPGRPDDAGPPDGAGPPEGVPGKPEDVGPPEGVPGKPEDVGPPEGLPGKPEDVGPPEGVPGKPEDAGPPEGVPGEPDDAGLPEPPVEDPPPPPVEDPPSPPVSPPERRP